jgi:hypothetical protein
VETIETERKKETQIKDTRANVKRIVEEIKLTSEEIRELVEERKRDEQSQSEVIEKLRDDLQELRAKSVLEGKFQKKEAKAYGDANRRVYQQTEKQKQLEINNLQKRIELEMKVHEETAAFLERKHGDLQKHTEHWDSKYEGDIEEKERQLEALKSKRANDLIKLNDLKQKYLEVQQSVMKEKRLAEARAFHKMMQAKRAEAALSIQTSFRKYKKRKAAKEKLKKLKKEANQDKERDNKASQPPRIKSPPKNAKKKKNVAEIAKKTQSNTPSRATSAK